MPELKTNHISSVDRISQLQAQIEQIKGAAIEELQQRRSNLQAEIAKVTSELESLTGKPASTEPRQARRARREEPPKKLISLAELKDLLAGAPEKTISIRKEHYDLANIKKLADYNPGLLRMGGNGPWPTVTLLR